MPKISQQKKDKISEQILHHLFIMAPQALFTSQIAESLARDEEFTKALLTQLKSKNLIIEINKNPKGTPYIRRQRWRLSDNVYNIYKQKQSSTNQQSLN